MSETVLRLIEVHKTFTLGALRRRSVRAVRGVSMEVKKGDVYGFLGPNGAGKTTTVRCILGLTRHEAGTILRLGQERFDPVHFFKRTAYCPEESHFPPYLTGRELLTHWAGMFGVEAGTLATCVTGALDKVGIAQAANRRIGTYSKGMKQRVGIAGCLLSDPDLVILDEPARGLDPVARHIVRNVLVDLAAAGTTIFMNSHILSEVERICSRVAIIIDGVIERDLPMAELQRDKGIDVVYRPGPDGTPAPATATKGAHDTLKLTVLDTAQLARFTQQVADAGGEVVRAARRKIDLEEYFIRVVKEGEK